MQAHAIWMQFIQALLYGYVIAFITVGDFILPATLVQAVVVMMALYGDGWMLIHLSGVESVEMTFQRCLFWSTACAASYFGYFARQAVRAFISRTYPRILEKFKILKDRL